MSQLDMFAPPRRLYADVPRARAADPATSHAAADELKHSGRLAAQQNVVLAAVREYPGCTSRELAAKISGDRYVFARRLPELEVARQVAKGAERMCSVGGRPAVTWWPA